MFFCLTRKTAPANGLIDGGNEMWLFDSSNATQHISSSFVRSSFKLLRASSDLNQRQIAIQVVRCPFFLLLCEAFKNFLSQKLVEEEFLAGSTAKYMLENWDSLFLAPVSPIKKQL
jgi:hypothetical protein